MSRHCTYYHNKYLYLKEKLITNHFFANYIKNGIFDPPDSLEHLYLGCDFDIPLNNFKLPTNLNTFTLSHSYNQSLDNVIFNDCLKNLSFGERFNTSIDNIKLPPNLFKIFIGYDFNQSITNVIFPNTLEIISFGYRFSHPLNNLPHCLNKLYLSTFTCELFNLPTNLSDIYIYHIKENNNTRPIETSDKKYILNKIKVPFGCNIHDRFFVINFIN